MFLIVGVSQVAAHGGRLDIAGEEIDPNNPDGDSEPESEAAFVSNQNNFLK